MRSRVYVCVCVCLSLSLSLSLSHTHTHIHTYTCARRDRDRERGFSGRSELHVEWLELRKLYREREISERGEQYWNRMKKNPLEPHNVRLQNFCRHGDRLKGVELVEQILATRDDTRLSLHVKHGNVSLHWTVASCVRLAHYTQQRRTLAVRRPE